MTNLTFPNLLIGNFGLPILNAKYFHCTSGKLRMMEKYLYFLLLINLINFKTFAQDGSFDFSFGSAGKVTYSTGLPNNEIKAMAVQSDRKILCVGTLYNGTDFRITLARYNSNGSLDITFDGDGRVITSVGLSCIANSIVILSSGKIMVGGYVQNSTYDMLVLRYNSNGSLDNTFDGDGIATVDFGADDYGYSMKVQADGKVVISGTAYKTKNYFALVRLKTDGTLDAQFDGDGMLTKEISSKTTDFIQDINIQSNNKIITVGSSRVSSTYTIVINRYNENGTLDSSFDGDGMAIIQTGKYSIPSSSTLQIDEKILLCGYTYDTIKRKYQILVARCNTNGKLDTDFDRDGLVTTAIDSGNALAYDIVVQNDNKILVCGYSDTGRYPDVAIVRYNLDGSLDEGFGNKGITMTQFNLINRAYALAIQSDGKFLIGGFGTGTDILSFVDILARYNTDGSLDKTFDGDGKVYLRIGHGNTGMVDMALQKDGKILIFGECYMGINTGSYGFFDLGLRRFNSNGSIDSSFKRYFITFSNNDVGSCIGLQSDGKIITGGYTSTGNGRKYAYLIRYNSDGIPDSTFANVVTDLDSGNLFTELTIQKDDKIVAIGITYTNKKNWFSVVRFTKDGKLDSTFGSKGAVRTGFGSYADQAVDVAIQKDGKIVVAGYSSNGTKYDMAVVRYNTDGSLDNSFNGAGKVTVPISNESSYANSLAIQEDGKIVLAGSSNNGVNADFAIARLNSDGSLDNSFDNDGMLTTSFRSAIERCNDIKIQPDGKILATGYSDLGTGLSSQFAYVRYNGNGTLDKSFDADGKLLIKIGNGNNRASNSLFQPDGKIISVGSVTDEVGWSVGLVRLNNKFKVGIHQVAQDDILLIYPNPSKGVFNLKWKGSEQAEIQIYSMTGMLVVEQKFKPQIDLSNIEHGMYIIKVTEGDSTWVKKVVLE